MTSGTPPSPRDSHSCSSWRNKFIVVGGEDGHDYYLSDVHILDTGIMTFFKSLWLLGVYFSILLLNLKIPYTCLRILYMMWVFKFISALLYFIRYSYLEGAEYFWPFVDTPSWSFHCCFWKELICFWGIYRCPKSIQWPFYAWYWYVSITIHKFICFNLAVHDFLFVAILWLATRCHACQ